MADCGGLADDGGCVLVGIEIVAPVCDEATTRTASSRDDGDVCVVCGCVAVVSR